MHPLSNVSDTHRCLFRMEYEMTMRQTVEADVGRLRKILDDTNVIRLHLESDIESLREELISLRKNHEAVRTRKTENGTGKPPIDLLKDVPISSLTGGC